MTRPPPPANLPDGAGAGQRVGVFDSGVGGLSVLRALRQALPGCALHYVADSAHAPYGERDETHVIDRSMRITRHLLAQGAQTIVIACNTATAVAAETLRATLPQIAFVGVEPGIKPALLSSPSGRIAVMATAATLASEKFRRLVASHREDQFIHLQACTGLAVAIERGDLAHPDIEALVEQHCRPMREAEVDTVVLGCTHYPFVENLIRRAMGPQVAIVDTAEAVARRTAQVMSAQSYGEPGPSRAAVLLESTGDPGALERFARRWLPFEFEVGAARSVAHTGGARDGD